MADAAARKMGVEEHSKKVLEVLQSWPLYRELKYEGKDAHATHLGGHLGNVPQHYAVLPSEITLYCPHHPECEKETQWEIRGTFEPQWVFFSEDRFHERLYTCRNCKTESVTFFLKWRETSSGGALVKVGQFPPLSHEPPKELGLDGEDWDYYRKALDCRNFNFGLGAVAYLRKVFDDRVDNLLDRLAEAVSADQGEVAPDLLEQVKLVKQARQVENKLEVAKKLLPARLKRGHDPIGDLYDLVSDALHRRSEGECIDVFDTAKTAFEYLFSQLEHERIGREQYQQSLRALREKSERLKASRARAEDRKGKPSNGHG